MESYTGFAKMNASVKLSCHSKGQPLRLCFWEHRLDNRSRVVYIDGDVDQNDGEKAADGFATGKCVLNIQAVGVNDMGLWYCTLVSKNGDKFTGVVMLGEL